MTPRQRQLVINDTVELNRAAFALIRRAGVRIARIELARRRYMRVVERDEHRELLRLAKVLRRISDRETRRANVALSK